MPMFSLNPMLLGMMAQQQGGPQQAPMGYAPQLTLPSPMGGHPSAMIPTLQGPAMPQPQQQQQGQAGVAPNGLLNGLLNGNAQSINQMKGLLGMFTPSAGGIPGGSNSPLNWITGGTGSLTGGDVNALTNMYGPGMGAGVSPY